METTYGAISRGRLRSAALLALLAVAAAALSAATAVPARAALSYEAEVFGSAAQPTFVKALGLAVDSSGDVLVMDRDTNLGTNNGSVLRFHSDGTPAPFSALGTNVLRGTENPQGGLRFNSAANQNQIAVDNTSGIASGDIYVIEPQRSAVDVFASTGTWLGRLTGFIEAGVPKSFTAVSGVAVDATGSVYVSDGSMVHRFVPTANPPSNANNTSNIPLSQLGLTLAVGFGSSSGSLIVNQSKGGGSVVEVETRKYDIASGQSEYSLSELDTTVTADPSTGLFYIAHGSEVRIFDASGDTPVLEGTITASGTVNGVAVDGATGVVYVSISGSTKLEAFVPAGQVPTAVTGDATEVGNTAAKISGTVNPAGNPTTYQFEYGTSTAYGQVTPASPAPVGSDQTDHVVEAQLTGLQTNTEYHYRVVAKYTDGGVPQEDVVGGDRTFRTSGPAGAETTGSPIRTVGSVQLEGRVNPQGEATSYHFEYGTQGSCDVAPCTSTAPVDAGSGDEIELVSQLVSGLAPGTTYHYRVVADNGNSSGASFGADMTVTTRANEDPLTHGAFPGPPGSDRAWEQVNGPDTGGNPVTLVFSSAFADDGSRAVYGVAGGTASSNAGSVASAYFTERTASGWQARAISPPRDEAPGNIWLAPAGKGDLSDFIIVNGDNQNFGSTSLWRQRVGAAPIEVAGFEPDQRLFSIVSDDASRVLAAATGSLDPSHPVAPNLFNLYDVSGGGAPRLIDLLPGETVPACGIASEETLFGMGTISQGGPVRGLHWLSADGSRAIFASRGDNCSSPQQLYVRDIPAEVTQRVSPPSLSGPECPAAFIKSTADAVFFWTRGRLASDDTIPATCGSGSEDGDIYRYDFATEGVTCVTCVLPSGDADVAAPNPNNTNEPAWDRIAVAENGSRAYFESSSRLVSGAATPGFYRVDTGTGDLRYIADAEGSTVGDHIELGTTLSRDGSVLIFRSSSPALNPIGGTDNGGTTQYYRYDDRNRSLTCASCPQDRTAASVSAPPAPQGSFLGLGATVYPAGPNNTPLDDAGDFVFSTPLALVPADQNTPPSDQEASLGTDIYEWRDGRLFLVTDGVTNWNGQEPVVAGITPSGRDIFFTAPKQYTADAVDAFPKLYDARVGGGFSFPKPPAPCPLEVCQGTPSGPPTLEQPGTASFGGPSNPPAAFPHRKRHHRRTHHRRGHHKKHQHRKNHNRRAGK